MPTTNSQLLLAVATAATALGGASATQVYLYVVPINSVATSTPSKISYNFSPSALAAADTFTITHDFQRYAADDAVACTLESTSPQVSDSSGTYTCVASGSGTVLTCTLDTGAVISGYNTVACTTNIAANPAVGTHTTTMVTTNDATASDPSSVTYTAVVSGKCGGNAVTATNIATASMIDVSYVAEEGYDAVALELDGLFEFDCGEGYQLKASPEGITATGLVAAMKVACCENASVSGKCSGNTATGEFLAQQADDGTFQFQCGTGTTLKSSSATITMKLTSNNMDDFGLNNICCSVSGKCSGNTATADSLAQQADDGTFQFQCGTGTTLKSSSATITSDGTNAVCCDMDTPDTPSVSGKCSGNTATADFLAQQADDGTFQFQCGTGTTLKSSSATITVVMSRINMEDVGLNNICCDMDTPSVSDTCKFNSYENIIDRLIVAYFNQYLLT